MFKRTLIVGWFVLFTFISSTAQDNQQNVLLIASPSRATLETTVSAIDIDTGVLETLFTVDSPHTGFSLSPAGDKLAYFAITPPSVSSADYWYRPSEVTFYIRDVIGEESRAVANDGFLVGNSSSASGIVPSWSPDGTQIAVVNKNEQTGYPQFTIIDATTGEILHILPAQPFPAYDPPLWSPDGTYLAYFSEYCTLCGRGTVYVISTTTEDSARPVVPDAAYERGTHRLIGWLPDSLELVISVTEGRPFVDEVSRPPMQVNVETGETATIADETFLSGQLAIIQADDLRISPDHTRVAVPTQDFQSYTIRVYSLTTTEELSSIAVPDYVGSIIWTPDSEGLVFQISSLDQTAIFMASANGSEEPREILEMEGIGGEFLGWAQT